jgi:hypothetical protein
MDAAQIARELQTAREELSSATAALAPKHKGGEWERYRRAHERCLALERDLARATGEECAVEIDWPVRWDTGAPLPHVVSSGARTIVVYLAREPDPNWDGSYANVVDPAAPSPESIVMATFEECLIYKFGAPNDEALAGHRLYGRGLTPYGAHTVERSRWIREQERINSVHPQHRPGWEAQYRHYLLAFHDETFECIARSHSVQATVSTFVEALARCAREIVS